MLVEKEVIGPGQYWYRDEATGLPRKLVVTPDLCRYWGDQGNKMIGLGLTVPVPYEHDFSAHPMTPKEKLLNNAGEVKNYYLKGEKLFSSVDVQDPDVKNKIGNSIRWTSPWISSFTDGDGREWKNVISHLALTTRPRIINQQPFSSIAAALSMARPISHPLQTYGGHKEGFCLTRACKLDDRGEPLYSKYFSLCAGVPLPDGVSLANATLGSTGKATSHRTALLSRKAINHTVEIGDDGQHGINAQRSAEDAYYHNQRGNYKDAADAHREAAGHHVKAAHEHHKAGRYADAALHAEAANAHFKAASAHQMEHSARNYDQSSRTQDEGGKRAFAMGDEQGSSTPLSLTKKAHGASKAAHDISESIGGFASGDEKSDEYMEPSKKARESASEARKAGESGDSKLAIEHHNDAISHHGDALEAHMLYGGPGNPLGHLHSAGEEGHRKSIKRHMAAVKAYKSGAGLALATDPVSKKKPPEKKADKPSNPLEALEDESDVEADAAQVPGAPEVEVIDPAATGNTPPSMTPPETPSCETPSDFPPPEELICDLLQALGVPMPDVSNDAMFKRHLYEAVMSKIKELTSKGMSQPNNMPDQNLPPDQQPNASQPTNNPLIQQEQQPMMMSLQDINKLEEPLRSVALSMHQETTKAQSREAEANKLLHSLRDSKLAEANAARKKRIEFLAKWMPSTKADLEAMLALSTMALSMGDGGAVNDPMAPTLSLLENGLANLPKLMTTDAASLSIQPQPTDDSVMTEERANEVADTFARAGGMGPAPKKQTS